MYACKYREFLYSIYQYDIHTAVTAFAKQAGAAISGPCCINTRCFPASCRQEVHLLSQLVLKADNAQLQVTEALRGACSPEGFLWQRFSCLACLQHGREAVDACAVFGLLQSQIIVLCLQGQQTLPLLIDESLGTRQCLQPPSPYIADI